MKSRRAKQTGQVARYEGDEKYRILTGTSERKNHSEDLGVDGRITLKWVLKFDLGAWIGFMWLRTETGGGPL
jgi:hypothetical protein